MNLFNLVVRAAVILLTAILIVSIASDETLSNASPSSDVDSVDLASSVLTDWSFPLVVLGLILSMAMIGAAYLVRDERLINLEEESFRGDDP